MSDAASLRVTVRISGMTPDEGAVAFANLPTGSTTVVNVVQPPIGGKRYTFQTETLSVKGASDLSTSVLRHCERVADSDG